MAAKGCDSHHCRWESGAQLCCSFSAWALKLSSKNKISLLTTKLQQRPPETHTNAAHISERKRFAAKIIFTGQRNAYLPLYDDILGGGILFSTQFYCHGYAGLSHLMRAVDLHTPQCFLMPSIQIHCVGERASSGARRFCPRLHQGAYITSRSTQGRRAPSHGALAGMRAYSQQQFTTGVALLCSG